MNKTDRINAIISRAANTRSATDNFFKGKSILELKKYRTKHPHRVRVLIDAAERTIDPPTKKMWTDYKNMTRGERICQALGLVSYETIQRNGRLVPLGEAIEQRIIRARDPRKKNYTLPQATSRIDNDRLITENHGRYSSRCTFPHFTYHENVTSLGYILNKKTLMFFYARREEQYLHAPRGWEWRVDRSGIYIVDSTGKKDFHPTMSDLQQGVKYVVTQARKNYKVRAAAKRAARSAKAARQQQRDVFVCAMDSLRAGNCAVGTEKWIKNNGLRPKKHYKLAVIELLANKNPRVIAVINQAIKRHNEEMTRGYALLADHGM